MYGDTQQAEKLLEMCFKDEIVNNQNRYSHALILGVSGALSRVGTIAHVPRMEQLAEKIKGIRFGVVALGVRIAEEELKKLDQELISETIKVCQSRQS